MTLEQKQNIAKIRAEAFFEQNRISLEMEKIAEKSDMIFFRNKVEELEKEKVLELQNEYQTNELKAYSKIYLINLFNLERLNCYGKFKHLIP
ncbi:hypothetical protein [Tenacibaculum aestuarii]|uniref:hypothetical protein n=1 Tax=Tenacibaculum aestuarii TaxID=362781 RepID=UPI003894AA9F